MKKTASTPLRKKVNKDTLKKTLQTKHLTMISIGGSIGTGLFVASGASIHTAGPGGALLAYSIIGVMVYVLMMSLGEMATYLPVSGSFSTYAQRFVDPALGFALGWNYWFNWAVTIAVELAASSIVMKFWFPHVPGILWSALFLAIIFSLNYLSAKAFGEAEYWFSLIKVVTIVIFLVTGTLTIFGIMGGEVIGFKNFTVDKAPIPGGFLSVLSIFMVAGFSFQGTELVGVAAGESKHPEKTVPKAINQIFWRILLFYILTIFIIGLLIPYTHPNLMNEDVQNIALSPFTLVFQKTGIAFAASIMNAVILTAILSAGNSGMYASTRMLWVLAKEGHAPRIFTKINKRGIPIYSLFATTFIGMLAFLSSLFGEGAVYVWLLNISGLSGFITWAGISISHYRFRKAYVAQGYALDDLPYRAKWFPIAPILSLILCLFIIFGQNYKGVLSNPIDWRGLITSYIGIPIFLSLWFGYKYKNKTKLIPLQECNVSRDI